MVLRVVVVNIVAADAAAVIMSWTRSRLKLGFWLCSPFQ